MVTFRKFKVGDLFDCSTTKSYNPNQGNLPNGDTPYVTRSAFNNGISGYFTDESEVYMNSGNCITIGAEGGIAFYQPDDFIAGIKVYTLRHERMNSEIGMYLCGALNIHSQIYSYTNARILDKIKNELIQLPVKPGTDESSYTEDDIDWDYMESYIHELEESYIHELDVYLKETGLDDYVLTDDEQELIESEPMFKEFKIGDLFTLTGLKQVKSQKNIVESETGIPFVVQSTKNNMVKCHVDRQALLDGGKNVYDGNAIVLGVTLPAVSYQELEFGASQVITARRDDLNPLRGLYIVTAMRKALLPKYSYTNKPGIQKYKDDIIQLPVKPGTDEINYTEDDIDWDYMESYIRTMEKQVITDVVDYKDSMITTAKELIYV